MPTLLRNPDIYLYYPYRGITLVYIHKLVVTVRQLNSVAQLVQLNRRAGSISSRARGPTDS